jgi:hypothetical protein
MWNLEKNWVLKCGTWRKNWVLKVWNLEKNGFLMWNLERTNN